jgi:hypothetical protein
LSLSYSFIQLLYGLQKVLQVIIAAFRPLRLNDLNVALSLHSDDKITKDTQSRLVPNFERMVQKICGPFVKIADSKLYLEHRTAKEFLFHADWNIFVQNKMWKYCLNPVDSHLAIGRA